MNVELYNFRKPGPLASELEHSLAAWLRDACALAPERWAKILPFRSDMSFQVLDTVRPSDGLARLSEASIGYHVTLTPGAMDTLLVLPRALALVLLSAALGDAVNEVPADRNMTVVEDSLCEYLVQQLPLAVLQEAWPGAEPVTLAFQCQVPQPKWCRVFAPDENLVACAFTLNGPYGQLSWQWLLPQQGLLELFAQAGQERESSREQEVRPRLETVVRELPVGVSVTLGAVDLPLAQVIQLQPGDLVILNQRVNEPLTACVEGEKKLRVWPGRVGSRQAFRVESLYEG